MSPGAEILHLLDVQPVGAVGSGPLFGLALTPDVWWQLQLPPMSDPFDVFANSNGEFSFIRSSSVIPLGLVVDMLTIEIPPPGISIGFVSPVRRITF